MGKQGRINGNPSCVRDCGWVGAVIIKGFLGKGSNAKNVCERKKRTVTDKRTNQLTYRSTLQVIEHATKSANELEESENNLNICQLDKKWSFRDENNQICLSDFDSDGDWRSHWVKDWRRFTVNWILRVRTNLVYSRQITQDEIWCQLSRDGVIIGMIVAVMMEWCQLCNHWNDSSRRDGIMTEMIVTVAMEPW